MNSFSKKLGQSVPGDYINLLFDRGENICVCPTVYENIIVPRDQWQPGSFLCINPIRTARKNEDVSAFRNFLIEIDSMDLGQQLIHLKSLQMPYSALVYSGNKSFHYIISLRNVLSSADLYEFTAQWIHNIVKHSDTQTKNPARLTRFPDVVRHDTGKRQRLIYVHDRINNDELMAWLEKYPDCVPSTRKSRNTVTLGRGSEGRQKIIQVVDWYVETYLNESYSGPTTFVQCPLCAEDGHDKHKDNMVINGDDRLFHCFANEEHGKHLLKKLHLLKREYDRGVRRSS